ncbi:hypothetical protein DERP_003444 [Dermatophagoides pteronyssinus]|uniref:Uncharacterized protein n=1 Tax=Dermatophagoides pteronyssinus TaxID=6956 RepID=A0ABQ8JK01_DERPT|nr:hypothetical protein DERP_003444 [Dermatophagoides pteronyssinus]
MQKKSKKKIYNSNNQRNRPTEFNLNLEQRPLDNENNTSSLNCCNVIPVIIDSIICEIRIGSEAKTG